MADSPPTRDLVRIALRSLPILVFLGVCGIVVRYSVDSDVSADTYFHLRFGHEFLTDWSLRHPRQRHLARHPGVAADAVVGPDGDGGPRAAASAWPAWRGTPARRSSCWPVAFFLSARRHTSGLAASLITFFSVLACQPALSGRPQVLSYVFVAVFTAAWLASVRDGRPRWWLVPLLWVWATVHGMWPLGIVIGLAAATGISLDRVHPLRARLRLFLVPVLGAVAAAFTPVGPGLYGAVLTVGSRAEYFYEWGPPDFTGRMAMLRPRCWPSPWRSGSAVARRPGAT